MLQGVSFKSEGDYALLVGNTGAILKFDGTSFIHISAAYGQILWDIAWKPDGSYALIVSDSSEVLKFNGYSFTSDWSGSAFGDNLCYVNWHPNGLYAIITAARHATLWTYDGATFSTMPLRAPSYGVEWRHDGIYALIVGSYGQIVKYDGISLLYLSATTARNLWDVAWKPDGSYALIISQNGEVLKYDGLDFLYDYADSADFYGDYRCSVDWSSNGIWSVITGYHYRYRRYGSERWNCVWRYDGAEFVTEITDVMPYDCAFQPGGDYCVIVGDSGHAWTYDSINLMPIPTNTTTDLRGVAWKPDGSYALIVGKGGEVLKFDGLWTYTLNSGVSDDLTSVAWSVDGNFALICGTAGRILKYDGLEFATLDSNVTEDLSSVDFAPGIGLIVGKSGRILRYEKDALHVVSLDSTVDLQGVDFSPSDEYALITGKSGHVWKAYLGLPPSPLGIEVIAAPSTIKSGETSQLTITVTNGSEPVSGASILPHSLLGGSFSEIIDHTNGNYSCAYIAPILTESTTDRVVVEVVKTGFAHSSGYVDIEILPEIPYFQQIESYFPYWKTSIDEEWHPTSFYFDNDGDVENNKANYESRSHGWNNTYVYIHIAADQDYVTIGYWLYYVYSDWLGSFDDHHHDWDSVIYVVLNRTTLTPEMVGFSHHIQIDYLLWNDPSLETVGSHPVAYVAEGSHAAYPSPTDLSLPPYFDLWNPGGTTYGPENLTSLVIVGAHISERQFTIDAEPRWFCLLSYESKNCTHPAPSDVTYAGRTYWPKKFPTGNPLLDLFTDWDDPPWHRSNRWYATTPKGIIDKAIFVAYSPVDVLVTDNQGHSVGTNATGHVELNIEQALYTGADGEPEIVIIPNPTPTGFQVKVSGTQTGTFNLTVTQTENNTILHEEKYENVAIEEGQELEFFASLDNEISTAFEIEVEDTTFTIGVCTNATVWDVNFNAVARQIKFRVTGEDGTVSFCNLSIPSDLLWVDELDEWEILIDDDVLTSSARTIAFNGTHYMIDLVCPTSTIRISIIAKYVIPEFPAFLILPLFMIAALLVAIAYRRKHSAVLS